MDIGFVEAAFVGSLVHGKQQRSPTSEDKLRGMPCGQVLE